MDTRSTSKSTESPYSVAHNTGWEVCGVEVTAKDYSRQILAGSKPLSECFSIVCGLPYRLISSVAAQFSAAASRRYRGYVLGSNKRLGYPLDGPTKQQYNTKSRLCDEEQFRVKHTVEHLVYLPTTIRMQRVSNRARVGVLRHAPVNTSHLCGY